MINPKIEGALMIKTGLFSLAFGFGVMVGALLDSARATKTALSWGILAILTGLLLLIASWANANDKLRQGEAAPYAGLLLTEQETIVLEFRVQQWRLIEKRAVELEEQTKNQATVIVDQEKALGELTIAVDASKQIAANHKMIIDAQDRIIKLHETAEVQLVEIVKTAREEIRAAQAQARSDSLWSKVLSFGAVLGAVLLVW